MVTVTLMETAVVVEGSDTVYRYDLTADSIRAPWAHAAIVAQVRQLCSLEWPAETVTITTQAPVSRKGLAGLVDAFAEEGVAVIDEVPEEQLREDPPTEEIPVPEFVLPEPVDEVPVAASEPFVAPELVAAPEPLPLPLTPVKKRRFGIVHAAIIVIVGAVVGLSWWSLDHTPQGPSVQAADAVPSADPSGEPSGVPSAGAPLSGEQPPEEHQAGGLRVSTPAGFHAENLDGVGMILSGQDKDLRIHVTADPVYTVSPQAVLAEVAANVEDDPTLTMVQQTEERAEYKETPGDGSEVQWRTWVENGSQISVGCQTRRAPTASQKASCRVALESVSFSPQVSPGA